MIKNNKQDEITNVISLLAKNIPGRPGADTFECCLCNQMCYKDNGAYDAVERVMGDSERGICNCCWFTLPNYVIEWCENFDEELNKERIRQEDNHASWQRFLHSIDPVSRNSIIMIWSQICTPDLPYPLVKEGETSGSIAFSWNNENCRLEIEILLSGKIHWFFRNRKTENIAGTEDDNPVEFRVNDFKQYLDIFKEKV